MKIPFLEALQTDIPAGVASFLETPFGDFTEIAVPTTKDESIIACGKLSAHLNNFLLMPFAGLTPVELLLRIGQKNPVLISSLLSGLELISGGGGKFDVIAPAEGGVYPNFFELICAGQGIASIDVALGEDTASLTEAGAFWKGSFSTPLTTGKHSAAFVATFEDDSTDTIAVNFETTASIELVSTFPSNETSYTPEEIDHISVTLSGAGAEENNSLTASVFGQVFTLVKTGANYYVELMEIYSDFTALNIMSIRNHGGDELGNISFILTEGGNLPET
jgi:hypothetical protein